jgi:hypothetical protein
MKFFAGDGNVIGLAYYLQTWFRFKLQEWISSRSRELEAKEGVYSLEMWNEERAGHCIGNDHGGDNADSPLLEQTVNADGDYQNSRGTVLSADVAMLRKPLDISELTLDWGRQTEDPAVRRPGTER